MTPAQQRQLLEELEQRVQGSWRNEIRDTMRQAADDIRANRSIDATIRQHGRRSLDLVRLTYEVAGDSFARPIYEKARSKGLVTKDFERFTGLLDEFINEVGAERAAQIFGTTADQVRDALTRGTAEGLSIAQIAADLRARAPSLALARAAVIARTESHSAAMWSQVEAIKDTGLELRKQWIAAKDERTRTLQDGPFDHAAMDGETVDMDQPFIVGGEQLEFPGDPNGSPGNIINCRCVMNFVE